MAVKHNASPREGLTFDDVLIKPGLSEVLPADVDIRSHITRSIRSQTAKSWGLPASLHSSRAISLMIGFRGSPTV